MGDAQERKIYIYAKGPARCRRNLLAIVRNDFERIHNHIKKLQPPAMVPVPKYPAVLLPYEKLLKFEKRAVRSFRKWQVMTC